MKRIVGIFILLVSLVSLGGCSTDKSHTNISSLEYLEGTTKENIEYNLRLVSKKIKNISFNGVLTIENKPYEFEGNITIKNTIEDSLLHVKFRNNNLYLSNGKIYLSYFYKDTNVIVKDDIEKYVEEINEILLSKGKSFNENTIINFIKTKTVNDIDFKKISEKMNKTEDGFEINSNNIKIEFNNKYLVENLSVDKSNVSLDISFEYEDAKIKVPLRYDLINVSIETIKKLLRVDNIGELLK